MGKIHKEKILKRNFKRNYLHLQINQSIEWILVNYYLDYPLELTISHKNKDTNELTQVVLKNNKKLFMNYNFKLEGTYKITMSNTNYAQIVVVKPSKNDKISNVSTTNVWSEINEDFNHQDIEFNNPKKNIEDFFLLDKNELTFEPYNINMENLFQHPSSKKKLNFENFKEHYLKHICLNN